MAVGSRTSLGLRGCSRIDGRWMWTSMRLGLRRALTLKREGVTAVRRRRGKVVTA